MSSNIGEKARESAALRAEKRAAALRENLKRRKDQTTSVKTGKKEDDDADHKDSE